MNDPLLPCPFCGGTASKQTINETMDATPEDSNFGGSFIECDNCGACTRLEFDRKENLESAWNSRIYDRREALAKRLAAVFDNIILPDVRSTVMPPRDAANWREYLAKADDFLAMCSEEMHRE